MSFYRFTISTNGSKNSISDVSIVLLCIFIILCEIPVIYRIFPGVVNYGSIFLMGMYLLLNFGHYIYMRGYTCNTLVLLVGYASVQAFYKIMRISSAELFFYFNSVKFFFFFLVLAGTFQYFNKKQMKWILIVSILSISLTLVHNIFLCAQYGSLVYVNMFKKGYEANNVVDTQYVSALLLLIGSLTVNFLQGKKFRILSIVLVVFFTGFSVLIAQRAIMLVLCLLMFSMLVFFNKERQSNVYIFSILVLLVGIIAVVDVTDVLIWLSELIDSPRISKRLNQIIIFLSTQNIESSGGSLTTRFELIVRSLETLTSSVGAFFMGVGDHRSDNLLIGNHSDLIDELARYGIIVGVYVYWLLFRCYKIIIKRIDLDNLKSVIGKQLNVILFVILIRAFLGGFFEATIGIQLFLIVPIVFKLIGRKLECPKL